MKQIGIAMLVLSVAASSFAGDTNVVGKTYAFTIPDDVTFESHDKIEFYSFRWGEPGEIALFMLNVNPAPLTARALKPMADMMEVIFEDEIKKQGDFSVMEKKRTEIECGPFKGTELEFVVSQPAGITVRQYAFILHDGDRAWNGQLTASSTNDISKAHTIMKKAKSIASKAIDSDGQ